MDFPPEIFNEIINYIPCFQTQIISKKTTAIISELRSTMRTGHPCGNWKTYAILKPPCGCKRTCPNHSIPYKIFAILIQMQSYIFDSYGATHSYMNMKYYIGSNKKMASDISSYKSLESYKDCIPYPINIVTILFETVSLLKPHTIFPKTKKRRVLFGFSTFPDSREIKPCIESPTKKYPNGWWPIWSYKKAHTTDNPGYSLVSYINEFPDDNNLGNIVYALRKKYMLALNDCFSSVTPQQFNELYSRSDFCDEWPHHLPYK